PAGLGVVVRGRIRLHGRAGGVRVAASGTARQEGRCDEEDGREHREAQADKGRGARDRHGSHARGTLGAPAGVGSMHESTDAGPSGGKVSAYVCQDLRKGVGIMTADVVWMTPAALARLQKELET